MMNGDDEFMRMHISLLSAVLRKLSAWIAVYALLVVAALLLVSCTASVKHMATPAHTMTLSDHEFAPVDFVPKPGEKIQIINHSDISHSIYVTYPDGSMVNLGVQTPGKAVSWVVPADAKGEYVLQCWIHPIIRAKLLVDVANVSSSSKISLPSFVSTSLTSQENFNGRQNICSSRNRRT